MSDKISISICTFQSGDFDVMIRDVETGHEVTLSGNQKVEGGDFEFITDIAPACVWTRWTRDPGQDR